MEKSPVKHIELEPLPDLVVEYYSDTSTLVLDNGGKWSEGEEIARGLTVFYDSDNKVVGFTMEYTESWLKPFVDAILAKQRGEPVPPVLRSIGGVAAPCQEDAH